MSDDENKKPRWPEWRIGQSVLAALLGRIFAEQVRVMAALTGPAIGGINGHSARHGGALARQQWKRRRASGWDR